MLDMKFIRENPDAVKENIKKKFQDAKLPLVDEVIELDAKRRASIAEADQLRADRNRLSKQVGMVKAFELVRLGEDDVKAKFPAMYNAFCYGAPPHAGIAPGVDRMVMLLAGEDSIREIIPFPMNKNAQDVMMDAPGAVTQKQLDELHIALVKPEA